jgi:hypothetical protein
MASCFSSLAGYHSSSSSRNAIQRPVVASTPVLRARAAPCDCGDQPQPRVVDRRECLAGRRIGPVDHHHDLEIGHRLGEHRAHRGDDHRRAVAGRDHDRDERHRTTCASRRHTGPRVTLITRRRSRDEKRRSGT